MFKRAALYLSVSLAAIAMAQGEDWHKSFTVTGQPELRVDAKDGSVTVHVWDQTSISANVSATGWRIGPGELEIVDHQIGGRVELDLRLPSARFGVGHRAIRMEIRVPRNTRLDIRTGDGSIRVYEVAGEMRLVTGDGKIEADGVQGTILARSGDGGVSVRGRLESVSLHTGDGSVELSAMPGSRLAAGWRIETGDGSVTVRLPSDLSADLDVRTGDGDMRVDLPFMSTQRDKKGLKGKLNGGGPLLSIRTGDGSVRLGRI
jgi:hypothetical protein